MSWQTPLSSSHLKAIFFILSCWPFDLLGDWSLFSIFFFLQTLSFFTFYILTYLDNASKLCHGNGIWEKTNYSQCVKLCEIYDFSGNVSWQACHQLAGGGLGSDTANISAIIYYIGNTSLLYLTTNSSISRCLPVNKFPEIFTLSDWTKVKPRSRVIWFILMRLKHSNKAVHFSSNLSLI